MRIRRCTIYALEIPFVEAFAHSRQSRRASDSFIVRLEAEDGTQGYGEGVARPYVTGETVEASVSHVREVLWPAVAACDYAELKPREDALEALAQVDESLPEVSGAGVVAFNAARCAVELALLDALLRRSQLSLAEILRPRRAILTYGAVVSSGPPELCARRARQLKLFGIREVKIKLVGKDDAARVRVLRETLGDEATLRVDANGAFDPQTAVAAADELAPLRVAAFEQPVARSLGAGAMRAVRERTSIPVMADESLVTLTDARALLKEKACDYFNLRLSKCGGISSTLRLARLARACGVRLQLGSQVGETAILSAAGRHVAAHLEGVEFVEGSYGKLLLTEDVGREPLHFGHGGRAGVLRGEGLGVGVRAPVLEKYAQAKIDLGEKPHA